MDYFIRTEEVSINGITLGGENPLCLIAGPCVIESRRHTMDTARKLADIAGRLDMPFIFKASYDKANRSSIHSYRGPGIDDGLEILKAVKDEVGCPILSDVHRPDEIAKAADVLDVLQVPAFLCRQTDLVVACAETMKAVNIKKGQFMAPWDMRNIIDKAFSTGNNNIIVTERGSCFGYNNLVVDMRSIVELKKLNVPVVFDATHSVQLPGGESDHSGGDRSFVPYLSFAAAGLGIDAIFLEVHEAPDKAKCDAANSIYLSDLEGILQKVLRIRESLVES